MANRYWNGIVDGQWDAVGNWWNDTGFSVPSGTIPLAGDTVYISGAQPLIVPPSTPIVLSHLYVGYDMPPTYFNATGTICNATFENGSYNFGTVTGNAIWTNGGNNGATGIVTGDAEWLVSGDNMNIVSGNAIFRGTSGNVAGRVVGNATFYDTTKNKNQVAINAIAIFYDNSTNEATALILGDATFYDNTIHKGDCVGNVVFNNNSYIDTTGSIAARGTATFYNNSYNNSTSLGASTCTFHDKSYNSGTIEINTFVQAIFNDSSYNSGTVNADLITFDDSSYNSGTITATISISWRTTGLVTMPTAAQVAVGTGFGSTADEVTFQYTGTRKGGINGSSILGMI